MKKTDIIAILKLDDM